MFVLLGYLFRRRLSGLFVLVCFTLSFLSGVDRLCYRCGLLVSCGRIDWLMELCRLVVWVRVCSNCW